MIELRGGTTIEDLQFCTQYFLEGTWVNVSLGKIMISAESDIKRNFFEKMNICLGCWNVFIFDYASGAMAIFIN